MNRLVALCAYVRVPFFYNCKRWNHCAWPAWCNLVNFCASSISAFVELIQRGDFARALIYGLHGLRMGFFLRAADIAIFLLNAQGLSIEYRLLKADALVHNKQIDK